MYLHACVVWVCVCVWVGVCRWVDVCMRVQVSESMYLSVPEHVWAFKCFNAFYVCECIILYFLAAFQKMLML